MPILSAKTPKSNKFSVEWQNCLNPEIISSKLQALSGSGIRYVLISQYSCILPLFAEGAGAKLNSYLPLRAQKSKTKPAFFFFVFWEREGEKHKIKRTLNAPPFCWYDPLFALLLFGVWPCHCVLLSPRDNGGIFFTLAPSVLSRGFTLFFFFALEAEARFWV